MSEQQGGLKTAKDKASRKKILLADDEQMVRLLVSTTIGGDEYELFEAEDGQQALELAGMIKPDLVILDVSMPKMNGFDVCRRIRQDPSMDSTRIMMLTAHGLPADRELGRQAGADYYFTKPFSPLDLLRKLRELLAT